MRDFLLVLSSNFPTFVHVGVTIPSVDVIILLHVLMFVGGDEDFLSDLRCNSLAVLPAKQRKRGANLVVVRV